MVKRRENKGWYHRRRPCRCRAQGTTCFKCGTEPPHHPILRIWKCVDERQMEQPATGLSESLLNLHERLAVQQSAERGWINQPKPEPEGESKSSPPAGHRRYCSLQSTRAPARLNQDFLPKRWMKFCLFIRPVWKRITKCIKSLSALWEGGRAGECATQWFHGNWRRGARAEIWRVDKRASPRHKEKA